MANKLSKERIFYIIITIILAIVIFLVSTIPTFPVGPKTIINLSIFYHFGVFFMFTFFLTLSLINKKMDDKTILIILLVSATYALSDEFHQLFVPGRVCSIEDMAIDFAGSICSVLVVKVIEKLKR